MKKNFVVAAVGVIATIFPAIAFGDLKLEGSWSRGKYLQTTRPVSSQMLAMHETGLDVFQISPAGTMAKTGSLFLGNHLFKFLVADEGRAFLLTENYLLTVDMEQPMNPVLKGMLPVKAFVARLQGDRLFLFGEQVHVVDVSQLNNPHILSQETMTSALVTGFVVGTSVIAISANRDHAVFEIQPNGELSLQNSFSLAPKFQTAEATVHGNVLYLAEKRDAGSNIWAVELDSGFQVEVLGSFQTDTEVTALQVVESDLFLAGVANSISILEKIRLGQGTTLFGHSERITMELFTAIDFINVREFFSVTNGGALERYNLSTEVQLMDKEVAPLMFLDVAFQDPFAFLVGLDQIEVLSFENPDEPTVIAIYPGLPDEKQRAVAERNVLHVASANTYRRYGIGEDGRLTLGSEVALPSLPGDLGLQDVNAEGDFFQMLVGENLLTLGGNAFQLNPLPDLNSEDRYVGLSLVPPFIVAQKQGSRFDIFELAEGRIPQLWAGPTRAAYFYPREPARRMGHLLALGDELFVTKSPEELRRIKTLNVDLLGIDFYEETLVGIGSSGLYSWDVSKPSVVQLLEHFEEVKGEGLIVDGDHLLTFGSEPNRINYFALRNRSESFFPLITSNEIAPGALVFFNSGTSEETVNLMASFPDGETQDGFVKVPSQVSWKVSLDSLFPNQPLMSLKVVGSSQVLATFEFNSQNLGKKESSLTQMHPVPLRNLDQKVTFHLPSDNLLENYKVTVATPKFTEVFKTVITLHGRKGKISEAMLAVNRGGPHRRTLAQLFPKQMLKEAVMVEVTCPKPHLIAGAFSPPTETAFQWVSHAFSQSADVQGIQDFSTGSSLGVRLGNKHFYAYDTYFLAVDEKGALLVNEQGQEFPLQSQAKVLDGAMYQQWVYFLTEVGLEIWNFSDGQLALSLPLELSATRILISENLLFLWRDDNVAGIKVFDLALPTNPNFLQTISLQGLALQSLNYHQGQLLVGSGLRLHAISWSPQQAARYLGFSERFPSHGKISQEGDFLISLTPKTLSYFRIIPDAVPELFWFRDFDDPISGPFFILLDYKNQVRLQSRLGFFRVDETMNQKQSYSIPRVPSFQAFQTRNRIWICSQYAPNFYSLDVSAPPNQSDHPSFQRGKFFSRIAAAPAGLWTVQPLNGDSALFPLDAQGNLQTSQGVMLEDVNVVDMVSSGEAVYLSTKSGGLIPLLLDSSGTLQSYQEFGSQSTKLAMNSQILVAQETNGKLAIYSLEDPSMPRFRSRFPENNPIMLNGFVLKETTLFAKDPEFGLRIFDLSDPNQPVELGSLKIKGEFPQLSSAEVVPYKDLLFFPDYYFLELIDVSDPTQPKSVQRITDSFSSVWVLGETLLTKGFFGTTLWSLSSPKNPIAVQRLEDLTFGDLVVQGSTIWMADAGEIRRVSSKGIRALIPWIEGTAEFQTRLQISNSGPERLGVELCAINMLGGTEHYPLNLEPFSVQELDGEDIFSSLGSYALRVGTTSPNVNASITMASNLTEPGQERGAFYAATPSHELRDGLVFLFPANSEDRSFVVVAPSNKDTLWIEAHLFGSQGFLGTQTMSIAGEKPNAYTLNDVFPEAPMGESLALVVTNSVGVLLDGVSLFFDDQRRSAMTPAFKKSALFLPPFLVNEARDWREN